jgi:chemotaxis protein methyltransferase CheR
MKPKSNYDKVRSLLYKYAGITLSANKDVMIDNRLQKLMRDTTYTGSVDDILNLINKGEYVEDFINAFTTNKTHFFREVFHFEDLKDRIVAQASKEKRSLDIWCSASSTGEEPYSIAITLKKSCEEYGGTFTNHKILSTDIDTNVLETAATGIYRHDKSLADFPSWIKPNQFFKRRKIEGRLEEYLIKVNDDLKRIMTFKEMNLNDTVYPHKPNQYDVIFCRNVLIYFNIEDQNKILKKLFSHLKIGGTLYLGHSENPLDLTPYVQREGHNIFIKLKDY